MADVRKPEDQEVAGQDRTEPQRGELLRRAPSQVTREPLGFGRDLFARDPVQLMRDFARNPFQMVRDLLRRDEMPRWSPDFEVRETMDSYVFKADVPGARRDDLDISLVGNRLQITGKRDEEEEARDDTYYTCERDYGSFIRAFTLPDTADTEHVNSELRDGVLTLVVPKKPEAQPRRIQIGTGEKH